jgi:hypothetical protein
LESGKILTRSRHFSVHTIFGAPEKIHLGPVPDQKIKMRLGNLSTIPSPRQYTPRIFPGVDFDTVIFVSVNVLWMRLIIPNDGHFQAGAHSGMVDGRDRDEILFAL